MILSIFVRVTHREEIIKLPTYSMIRYEFEDVQSDSHKRIGNFYRQYFSRYTNQWDIRTLFMWLSSMTMRQLEDIGLTFIKTSGQGSSIIYTKVAGSTNIGYIMIEEYREYTHSQPEYITNWEVCDL